MSLQNLVTILGAARIWEADQTAVNRCGAGMMSVSLTNQKTVLELSANGRAGSQVGVQM